MSRLNGSISAKLSPTIPENEPLKCHDGNNRLTINPTVCSSVAAPIDLIYLAVDLITRHFLEE